MNYLRTEVLRIHFFEFWTFYAYLGLGKWWGGALIILLIVALVDNDKECFMDKSLKITCILETIFMIMFIPTIFYIVYTTVGVPGIAGVQPRYFFPLFFPFIFIVININIKEEVKRGIFTVSSYLLIFIFDMVNYY